MSRWSQQDGSAAFPTIVAVLLLMFGLGWVVYMARVPAVAGEIQTAAATAARAGAQASTVTEASRLAEQVARGHLSQQGIPCRSLNVDVAVPGGGTLQNDQPVTVRLDCVVHSSDITWVRLPTRQRIGAEFTVYTDRYRGQLPGG